jgi:IS30 family transposase
MRLDDLDPTDVDRVANIINGQRRRSLNYHSPASLYAAATVH